jgi:sialidase-1
MMNLSAIKLLAIFLFLNSFVFSQEAVPVFISGNDGYKTYRIPAIIMAPNNELLAFCEGRVKGSADFGDIDIVMKRSNDGGKTWAPMQKIVDMDSLQAGNPAPVVDLSDPAYPGGRIFLFYNTGNNHEGEVRKGNGLREVWYITSTDNGKTWSTPQNITLQVHRPNQPLRNSLYNFSEDWRSYANTPGHALQLTAGNFKGRIFVAANHSEGSPKKDFTDYFMHGFYTNDHGASFHLSQTLNLPGSNESTAAEVSNGGVMVNARNQKGDIRRRIVAPSVDGGQTWKQFYFDQQLPDPVCEGSILNIGKRKGKFILAFSNAADIVQRNNLTLRISYDEGISWVTNILIEAGKNGGKNDATAYSDLVKLNKKRIGVLYERDDYKQIVFKSVHWGKTP